MLKTLPGPEGFVDDDVCVLGVLDEPLVREGVTREHELAVLPFERKAHRARHDVHRRPSRDLYAVFVVDHRELVMWKLVDLDLPGDRV
jgi:hypothetical protein